MTSIKTFNYPDEIVYSLESALKSKISEYEIFIKDKIILGIICDKGDKISLTGIARVLNYIPCLKNISRKGCFSINHKNQTLELLEVPFQEEPIFETLNETLYNSLKNVLGESQIPFQEKFPGVLPTNKYTITCLYSRVPKGIYCNEVTKYEDEICIGYFREYDQEHLALIKVCDKCGKGEIYDWMNLNYKKHSC
jgi:hypothetical protein